MARSTVFCLEKHTPLNPHKDRVRKWWIKRLDHTKRVVTISHGALGVLDQQDWRGPIHIVDTDWGVIESTRYMAGLDGKLCDFPDLTFARPVCMKVEDYMPLYCAEHGVRDTAAIDLDLAVCVEKCWPTLSSVVGTLNHFKYKGKVYLTFRNGRDCFGRDGLMNRLAMLATRLPTRAKITDHVAYRSGRINDDASRSVGSPMCIVEIRLS